MSPIRRRVVVAAAVLLLGGCDLAETPATGQEAAERPTAGVSVTEDTALAALEQLAVKGRAPKTGYDRDAFAYREYDHDHNGCD